MPRRPQRVLAIDPGTREMGVAVLQGDDLLCHSVEVFTRRASRRKILADGRAKVLRLLEDFRPAVVVIEKTLFPKEGTTTILHVFTATIVAIVNRKRLPVVQFSPSTVKKAVCGYGHADKGEVARAVVAHFPELTAYLRQDRKWKDRFQANRFDAIAIALCFQSREMGRHHADRSK